MLQHMLWHEGYHHGQIKLTLKATGRPITDEKAGPLTWDVWMCKKRVAGVVHNLHYRTPPRLSDPTWNKSRR